MINEILHGVSRALYAEFGDGYPIAIEDIEQGLTEPCFFIAVLRPSWERRLGLRWRHTLSLDVHHFPKDAGDNGAMMDVSERLLSCLELITLQNGDLVRGEQLSTEIEDGVLHFFVTYTMSLQESPRAEDRMDELNTHVGTGRDD